jgi:hypothetical protein
VIVALNILAIDRYLQAPQNGFRAIGLIATEGILPFSTILWPRFAKCEMPYTGPGGVLSRLNIQIFTETVLNSNYLTVLNILYRSNSKDLHSQPHVDLPGNIYVRMVLVAWSSFRFNSELGWATCYRFLVPWTLCPAIGSCTELQYERHRKSHAEVHIWGLPSLIIDWLCDKARGVFTNSRWA